MTIAFWCVLAMIVFPYIFTVIAKWNSNFDNHDPRAYLANTVGIQRRANNVQLNCFEATPAFGLAVLISQFAHAAQDRIDMFALAFVVCRILYAICYLVDKPPIRTLFWALGFACVISLFVIAA